MKAKWLYDSKLAKLLTPHGTCHTITIMWWIFTEHSKEDVSESLIRHESTHVAQFDGWFWFGILLYFIGLLTMWLPLWWLIPLTQLFYIWYGVEWVIRAIICKIRKTKDAWHVAYKAIAFEREADAMEKSGKVDDVDLFSFLKFYKGGVD